MPSNDFFLGNPKPLTGMKVNLKQCDPYDQRQNKTNLQIYHTRQTLYASTTFITEIQYIGVNRKNSDTCCLKSSVNITTGIRHRTPSLKLNHCFQSNNDIINIFMRDIFCFIFSLIDKEQAC